MFCGYIDINDYCNNRYSYTYANLVENNCYAVPDSGNLAYVYRQDLVTEEVILITPSDYAPLQPCDIDDESQGFNNWDCYQSFLNNGGTVNDPSFEQYKLAQNDIIQDCYKNLIDAGVLICIDNFITNVAPYQDGAYIQVAPEDTTDYCIHLPATEEDVINFSNILSQATLLNATNSNDAISPLLDYNNVAHFLNYLNLVNILTNYFHKLQLYATLKNNLLSDLQLAESISDIQNLTFYGYKPSSKSSIGTDFTAANETIIKSNTLDCIEDTGETATPCSNDTDCTTAYPGGYFLCYGCSADGPAAEPLSCVDDASGMNGLAACLACGCESEDNCWTNHADYYCVDGGCQDLCGNVV